ncbi:MAG TPA: hypothetical protein VNO21_18025, partial [Polyangiaceae bacterium]|nr:hypothetical protein [Polyangiaceae bacterium]
MSPTLASPAFVLAWSAVEPHRVGEVAFLPEAAKDIIFGRGRDDLMFVRQRPGSIALRPPLQGDGLSRQQLRLRPSPGGLDVERIGRCPMLVNGDPIDRARVQPGDALLLPSNVLFFVVARRRVLPKLAYFSFVDLPRFGEMDRFGIVGESPAAWELREMAARASGHATPHATIGDDLQDRREDVPLVVRHVLRELATTNPSLVSRFCTESGEVRMAGTLMVNLLRDTTLRTVPHLERLLWGAISESTDDVIAHNP